jgi:hypothetical protein
VKLFVPFGARQAIDFGSLPDGAYSEYREVPVAYRYAEINASGPSGALSLRPYDYSGEEPLPEGRHTYRLGSERDRATLDLEPTTGEE